MEENKTKFFLNLYETNDYITKDQIKSLNLNRNDIENIFNTDPKYDDILMFIKNFPFDIIDKIARRGDDRIKSIVCTKWPLLPSTYQYLIEQNENVRASLCGNPALPHKMIERLLNDKSEFVRNRMAEVIKYREIKEQNKQRRLNN